MMVDDPKTDVEKVNELVRTHHENVDIKGTEPEIPFLP